jgi:serine/threonine-protein kinase
MDANTWATVKGLLADAAGLPASEREPYIRQHCHDPALRAELLQLVANPAPLSDLVTHTALASGVRVGVYVVETLLGRGGMGEVYRARDTKLGRDVALKVLPSAFAADPARLARLEREARLLASLNHPHIAHVYGLEESNEVRALVMELVQGETLADRLAQGPIPIKEALPIARQICDALEAAHEHGIIHRDLKPANIKVRLDGTVKVLDFGLAKIVTPDSAEVMNAPTLTVRATQEGLILGTPAYMSPEQASGKPVDRRTDLWSFGVVLIEMLTGRRVFDGETVSDVVAAVLKMEPDWTALPADTPASVRRLLRRCLEKDHRRRHESAADARLDLDDALEPSASMDRGSPPASGSRRPLAVGLALGLSIGAIVAVAAVWPIRHVPRVQVARLTIPAPSEWYPYPRLAISSDGSRLAYITIDSRTARLVLRPIDTLETKTLLARTSSPAEGLAYPFFSPDGQWVAFFEDNALKKVSTTGGPIVTICPAMGFPLGGTWGRDDTIIFATTLMSPPGLWRISAGGGTPVALTRPDLAREIQHGAPEFLPGGFGVLFTVILKDNRDGDVAVLDLRTGSYKVIVRNGVDAHYAATGHLVYRVGETLEAVAFDLDRTETVGPAAPVLESVSVPASPGFRTRLRANVALAGNGTLIYVPASNPARTLAWFDRRGLEEPISAPPRAYTYPRLSPDGMRVALDVRDQENDIWIWDFGRKTLTRFTSDPALDRFPLWTPDARWLLFSSDRAGPANIYRQPSDGVTAERLTQSPVALFPDSISSDGTQLVVRMNAPGSMDLMTVSLDHDRQVRPLLQSPFNEDNGEISPNGNWLAYQSNESGRYEIYVRPFPDTGAGRWQVSTDGGTRPLWARKGQELFYLAATGALMSVRVTRGTTWITGTQTKLFDAHYYSGSALNAGRTYDVSPDGRRFLMIKPSGGSDSDLTSSMIVVVFNWLEELKARVPTR